MGYAPELQAIDQDLRDPAALLASRICHDLVSPLGAISNGLELLAMSGAANTPELALIEESIDSANARIRFFRVALGGATAKQKMARGEVIKLIADVYAAGRLQVKWDITHDPCRSEIKVGLLGIMCMESALPAGGEILVQEQHGEWTIRAFGSKIRFDTALWQCLSTGTTVEDMTAAQVHFALLRDALATLRRKPQIGHSDSAVSLRF